MGRVRLRRELISTIPELGVDAALDELESDIRRSVKLAFEALAAEMSSGFSSALVNVIGQRTAQSSGRFQARASREVQMLKHEIHLGLRLDQATHGALTVNTSGGPALVNLGEIQGNIQQVVGVLGQGGNELSKFIEELATAISAAEVSCDDKTSHLEQLQFIAEQAILPANERRPGRVRGALLGLRGALNDFGNVASVLAVAGPIIARHFGFQWPV